jgi:hypothetical protein
VGLAWNRESFGFDLLDERMVCMIAKPPDLSPVDRRYKSPILVLGAFAVCFPLAAMAQSWPKEFKPQEASTRWR